MYKQINAIKVWNGSQYKRNIHAFFKNDGFVHCFRKILLILGSCLTKLTNQYNSDYDYNIQSKLFL